MNKCMFSGRLTRDPELKEFSSGKKVVRFTLAVDRRFQNSEGKWESDPSFLDFEAWDKGAELIAQRLKKGSFMLIDDASVKTDRWEDKQSGEKKQKLCFRCNHFELLPILNAAEGGGEAGEGQDEAPQEPQKAKNGKGIMRNGKAGSKKAADSLPAGDDGGDAPGGEEEIPF